MDKFADGGQLLITSTMDDQRCFQLISEVLEAYPDVKNVELVDNSYKIDMSSWMNKKTIICQIAYNGQKKFLQFSYNYSTTTTFFLVYFVIFAILTIFISFILGIFISFIVINIISFAVGYFDFKMSNHNLQNRCEQYIRDINNILLLNEPTNNYKTSTTKSSDLTIKCPSCGDSISIGMKFCPSCGKEIPSKKFCFHCGTEMNPNMSFCPKCGNKVNC